MDDATPKSADETDERLRQRVGELVHELSQPLYAISNFTEACRALLERPGDLDKVELARLLTHIGQQARRGGDILRRLNQSRSQEGRSDASGAAEVRP